MTKGKKYEFSMERTLPNLYFSQEEQILNSNKNIYISVMGQTYEIRIA